MSTDRNNRQLIDPAEWVDLYGGCLYRYAFQRTREPSVAEDLVQETLLAALQSFDRFEGRSCERTWLVGILQHKLLDHHRRTNKDREVPYADDTAYQEFNPFEKDGERAGQWRAEFAPTKWHLDAFADLERGELREVLDRGLADLPRKAAMAFVLREVDGLNSDEICDLLNVSRNNLWVMLHRARLKLRHSLEAEWFRGHDSGSFQSPELARQHSEMPVTSTGVNYRSVTA